MYWDTYAHCVLIIVVFFVFFCLSLLNILVIIEIGTRESFFSLCSTFFETLISLFYEIDMMKIRIVIKN